MRSEPPVLVPRVVEEHLAPVGAGEVAYPERSAVGDVPEPGRVAGEAPLQLAARTGMRPQPPVPVPGVVKQYVGAAVAVEVACPERPAVPNLAEPGRIAGEAPP